MLPRPILIAAALAVAALAGPADARMSRNGMVVDPLDADRFEVRFRAGAAQSDYWCAAADFARSRVGNAPTTRVWRISPPPRRQGQGVTFSLSSAGAASSTGLLVFGGPSDGSMSIASAEAQCNSSPTIWRRN